MGNVFGMGNGLGGSLDTGNDEGGRGEKKRRSEGISQPQAAQGDSGGPFVFGESGKENRDPRYGRTAKRGNGNMSTQDFMDALMTFF